MGKSITNRTKQSEMIKPVEMFTIVCDNCGKDVNHGSEYSCWNDKNHLRDIACDSDWQIVDDKHYCPNCFEFDYDDNLIIKTK